MSEAFVSFRDVSKIYRSGEMEIRAVEVADVLRARDARVERQDRMRRETGLPLISFTMNIAGPVKRDAALPWSPTRFASSRKRPWLPPPMWATPSVSFSRAPKKAFPRWIAR